MLSISPSYPVTVNCNSALYLPTGSSMSMHDEPNPAILLATQAGKMAVSCQLIIIRTTQCVPQEKFPESYIK